MTWLIQIEGRCAGISQEDAKALDCLARGAGAHTSIVGGDGQLAIMANVEAANASEALDLAYPIRWAVSGVYPDLIWYGVHANKLEEVAL